MNTINVYLYYGFPVLDEHDEPIAVLTEQMSNEYIGKLHSVYEPQVAFEGNKGIFEAYWTKCRQLSEESGIEFGSHYVNRESEVIIIAVGEASRISSTGNIPSCLGSSLQIKPEWRQKLKAFCDLSGISFREPEWILAVSSVVNDY